MTEPTDASTGATHPSSEPTSNNDAVVEANNVDVQFNEANEAVREAMHNDLHSDDDNDDDDGGYDGERAHSFRQRRLTYSRHHILSDSAAAAVAELLAEGDDDDDEEDDEAEDDENSDGASVRGGGTEGGKKRGLPDFSGEGTIDEGEAGKNKTRHSKTETQKGGEPPKKKSKKGTDIDITGSTNEIIQVNQAGSASASAPSSSKPYLPSRILHAGEIVRRNSPTNLFEKRTGMYSHPSHPEYHLHNHQQQHSTQHHNHHHNHHNHRLSKWRQRFSFSNSTPDALLPFPRHIVGTYSCHGMEPVYDSDYENSDDDDNENENENENDQSETSGSSDNGSNGKEKAKPMAVKSTTTAKINQDRGGVAYPYGNSKFQALFACYDGHGEGGELVSQYALVEVQRLLEEKLSSLLPFSSNTMDENKGMSTGNEDEENEGNPKPAVDKGNRESHENSIHSVEEEVKIISKAFRDVFVRVDRGLLKEEEIEPMYSGTTACVVLMRQNKLFISNCGDSRAVLARRGRDNNLTTIALSIDQNPDSPGEKERILSSGGFVSPPPEPGLSARVWLDSSHTQIGLAMARSIGDHAVKGVGVIAEPVVRSHKLVEEDEFMIIATDGVWEFISSEEAVDIVGRHLDLRGSSKNGDGSLDFGASVACEALIKAASEKWHEYEGDYRDDITAIVIRLKDLWQTCIKSTD